MSHVIELVIEGTIKLLYLIGEVFFTLPSKRFTSKMEEGTLEEINDIRNPQNQTVDKKAPSPQTIMRQGEE